MYEEIQLALYGVISPERLEILLRAHQTLEELGAHSVNDELQQVIGLQDGISDNDLLVARIEAVLIISVVDALQQYGVVCTDQADLPILTMILDGIGRIEHYVIPITLVEIASSGLDNEEILAHLIVLFGTATVDDLLPCFERVNDSTIRRITALVNDMLDRQEEPVQLTTDDQVRIRLVNRLCGGDMGDPGKPMVFELSRQGIPPGRPIGELLDGAMVQIEDLPHQRQVYEYLGLYLYSDNDLTALSSGWRALCVLIEDDYRRQDAFIQQGLNLLQEIDHG